MDGQSDFGNWLLKFIFVSVTLIVVNVGMYFYIIAPFAISYNMDKRLEILAIELVAGLTMLVVFAMYREENLMDIDEFKIERKPLPRLVDISREIQLIFDQLETALQTKNVGTFDEFYVRIFDLANKLPKPKRKRILEKAEQIKAKMEVIKNEFLG